MWTTGGWTVTEQQAYPGTIDDVLERMDSGWLRLSAFIEGLTPAQLTRPTDAAGWTVKDHLANLVAWERSMVYLLQGKPRHEGLGVAESTYRNDDVDAINAGIRDASRDLPLDDVLAVLRSTHEQMRELVAGLTDADLRRTYSSFLPDEPGEDGGRPIVERIAGNTYEHFDEHLAWMEAIVSA
jgi:uncharacterized protein (TIGR03083 family)